MSENAQTFDDQNPRTDSTPGDHSHRTVQQIINELRISPLERFLLWLAKTDYYVLYISTYKSRGNLVGLGAMVVFTALLAFASSFYALTSTLIGEDVPGRFLICLLLSSIYTYGIVLIDREIVGATSSNVSSTLARLVFAVVIATAVSFPAKLSFFEGRIALEIDSQINEELQYKIDEIEALKESAKTERDSRLNQLSTAIEQIEETISSTQQAFDEELSVKGGIGPRSRELERILDRTRADLTLKNEEYQEAVNSDIYSQSVQSQIDKLESEINGFKEKSFDFLSKSQALNALEERDPAIKQISWFMLLFFMLLELVPLALKWSLGSTEYHLYIEARNTLNKQKIASITNHYIEKMQQDRTFVFDAPSEITDQIADVLEDEAKNVSRDVYGQESINDKIRRRTRQNGASPKASGSGESASNANTPPNNDETL